MMIKITIPCVRKGLLVRMFKDYKVLERPTKYSV